MSSDHDWDDAAKSADKFYWRLIAFLAVTTIGFFWALLAYEDHQLANETCTEREVRQRKEVGIPMYYDPGTGLAHGCTE